MTFRPRFQLTLLTAPIETLLSDRSSSFASPHRGLEVHLQITPNYVPYIPHPHTLLLLLYFPFHPRVFTHIHRNAGHENSMDRTPTKLFKTIIPRETAGCAVYTCGAVKHIHTHTKEISG